MRQKTDEEIIELCQMGDEEAFEELYKRFYKSTYYLAMQIANCDADAIDATQETFIEIHKSIKNLREIKVFRLWVKRIVVSKLNKIIEKNQAENAFLVYNPYTFQVKYIIKSYKMIL